MDDFFWGLILGAAIAGSVVATISTADWRADTVQRGLAAYCPLDGEWAWKGECMDE